MTHALEASAGGETQTQQSWARTDRIETYGAHLNCKGLFERAAGHE